jgi:hypothetical protein
MGSGVLEVGGVAWGLLFEGDVSEATIVDAISDWTGSCVVELERDFDCDELDHDRRLRGFVYVLFLSR